MNKKILIPAIIIMFLAIGIGLYVMFGKTNKLTDSADKLKDTTQKASNTLTGSLQSLFNIGKNQICTINYPDNSGSGTLYASEKKVRVDFSIKVENQDINNHIISDGEYVYVWTPDQTEGMKIKISEISDQEQKENKTDQLETKNLDWGKNVSYRCDEWKVDPAKFTIPANVKFTDFSNILKDIPKTTISEGTQTENKIDTSVCDSITDSTAKETCLNALKSAQ